MRPLRLLRLCQNIFLNTITVITGGGLFLLACQESETNMQQVIKNKFMTDNTTTNGLTETATLGGGCFWCTEAVYCDLAGVLSVTPGYAGGKTVNPTYNDVCSGNTGHAEVVQVIYNPALVSYETLLAVFWQTHDPTTRNRQGNDVGTQYRSVILYHSGQQMEMAEAYKKKLDTSGVYDAPVTTEIIPFTVFYKAEQEHLNFYTRNPQYSYCTAVIAPKIEKFRKIVGDKLK